jgi:putative ATP-dependent endonuclease of OLD family
MVRRDSAAKRSNISQVTFNRIAQRIAEVTDEAQSPIAAERARLQQALQPNLNEMFFTPKLILVEGIEDLAYITSWMILSDRWTEFRRHGCHVVPTNGKGYLIEPVIIAQALDIPVFVLFDADGNKTKASERDRHEIENKALLRLLGGSDSDPFPNAAVWGASYVQWPTNLGNVLKSEVDPTVWDQTFGEATKTLGNPEGSYIKNPVHIGDHVRLLKAEGHPPSSLDRLCAEIRFAAA